MTDNQPESAIEQRDLPPSNRPITLESWSCAPYAPCAPIVFVEYETCSLSMKYLSPIKFDYISDFVLIWLLPHSHPPHPLSHHSHPHSHPHSRPILALILALTLALILILAGHTFRTTTQVMWIGQWFGWDSLCEQHHATDVEKFGWDILYEQHYATDIDRATVWLSNLMNSASDIIRLT